MNFNNMLLNLISKILSFQLVIQMKIIEIFYMSFSYSLKSSA